MNNLQSPAHLWLGTPEKLIAQTISELQTVFCPNKGCKNCTTCSAIAMQQHAAVTWLIPEKQYTVEQIDAILHTCSFALDDDQHYFFVLQKADLLSAAAANRLLKIVEEPPHGYHFIFLAQRLQAILPTIQSRCVLRLFTDQTTDSMESALHTIFKEPATMNAGAFLKALEQENPNEQTTLEILDSLFAYWLKTKKRTESNQAHLMVHLLQQALLEPPMPGGSKIFWRNFYLQVQTHVLK